MSDVIEEFKAVGGGYHPSIVGKRFAGKKDGTWRKVTKLNGTGRYFEGREVYWTNEKGNCGCCWWTTFHKWCRSPRLVLGEWEK